MAQVFLKNWNYFFYNSSIDPDIIVGYEIEKLSIGYLIKRAKFVFDESENFYLGRCPTTLTFNSTQELYEDEFLMQEIFPGRILLNVWKLANSEYNLKSNTIFGCAQQVLGIKVPSFEFQQLYKFYAGGISQK